MSAPLVVNTVEGTVWTRRPVTRDGEVLYAPAAIEECPEFVMATYPELEKHGIAGTADVLPVPVGPKPQEPKPIAYAKKVTEAQLLLAHPSEKQRAAEWPWDMWCRICHIRPTSHRTEAEALEGADQHVKLYHAPAAEVHKLMAAGGLAELERLRSRVVELEAAPTTVYRAEHPDSGITLGHYGTEAAARAHCEAMECRSWPTGTTLTFDWIRDALPDDEDDGIAELVVTAGQNEESTTGYIVTALQVPSEYDEGDDE